LWISEDDPNNSFKIRSGSAGRSGTWPIRGWNRAGLKKNRGRKNPVWTDDPVDPTRPSQKLGCNPLTFFLLKRRRFYFFKKNWPGWFGNLVKTRWLGQNLELEPWTGSSLKKTMIQIHKNFRKHTHHLKIDSKMLLCQFGLVIKNNWLETNILK